MSLTNLRTIDRDANKRDKAAAGVNKPSATTNNPPATSNQVVANDVTPTTPIVKPDSTTKQRKPSVTNSVQALPPTQALARVNNPLALVKSRALSLWQGNANAMSETPPPKAKANTGYTNKAKAARANARHIYGDGYIRAKNIKAAIGASLWLFVGLAMLITGAIAFTMWFYSLNIFGSGIFSGILGFALYGLITFNELTQSPLEHGWNDEPLGTLGWVLLAGVDLGVVFFATNDFLPGKVLPFGSVKFVFAGGADIVTIVASLAIAAIIAFMAEPLIMLGLRRILKAFYICPDFLY